jgi:sugar lactone lactonase YvrE
VTVLADRYEGKRLNIPNDVVVDPDGCVWFTDPYYEGAAGPWSFDRANRELDHDSVYRLDPQPGGDYSITRVTFDTTRPNGLLFSLDYKTLYVAQSGREPAEARQLRAYPVKTSKTGTGRARPHDLCVFVRRPGTRDAPRSLPPSHQLCVWRSGPDDTLRHDDRRISISYAHRESWTSVVPRALSPSQ